MSSPVDTGIEKPEFGQIARNAIQDYIYVVDRMGKLVDANDRFLSELGIQPSQLSSVNVDSFISDDDRMIARRTWQSVADTKRVERCIRKMRNASGNQRVLDVFETPLMKDGRVLGIVGVARDVTEESALEDKIWETQENSEAALEYAVRASLGLIKGYVFSLQRMERLPNEHKERYSRVIVEEIETLGRNIENLLISRGQFSEVVEGEVCDVNNMIRDVAALLKPEAARREITFIVPEHSNEILLHTQCEAIHRILLNLADFCMLRTTHTGEIRLEVADYEEYIEITVRDSGPTVRDAELATLLGETVPSTTETDGGTIGSKLDLYVARLLCDSLGGGITARSTEDKHLEFVVMLPRKAVVQEGQAAAKLAAAGK